VLARAKKTLGDAYDRLGQYREAYGSYAEMNRLEQSPTVVPMAWDNPKSGPRFWQTLTANAPTLPPAQRSDVVMLLGFARSGTTLLENVLDSHPDIEAFEEVPAWDAAFALLRPQWLGEGVARPNKSEQLRAAQVTYFREIEQRRKKTGASFVVDKNPLRGLHAAPLIKMIPDQKYIFCIRHPFDVVLSCFRQRFDPNPATENFRTLKGTSDYYDLAMSQWFEYFTLANPLVHYLRYDDLVTNFEATVRGALDFIGVPWNDAVRSFSDTSQKRTAETPSYAKIRQGLSIGVQTYWKDYRFLFDTPDTAPLHKWAKHFKYDTA
jgi:hypothetical protein